MRDDGNGPIELKRDSNGRLVRKGRTSKTERFECNRTILHDEMIRVGIKLKRAQHGIENVPIPNAKIGRPTSYESTGWKGTGTILTSDNSISTDKKRKQ